MSGRSGRPAWPSLNSPLNRATVDGMTLRDWFANGALVYLAQEISTADASLLASKAYEIADAMLAERERGGE